jgi:hypothetical protein
MRLPSDDRHKNDREVGEDRPRAALPALLDKVHD